MKKLPAKMSIRAHRWNVMKKLGTSIKKLAAQSAGARSAPFWYPAFRLAYVLRQNWPMCCLGSSASPNMATRNVLKKAVGNVNKKSWRQYRADEERDEKVEEHP